MTTPLWCLLGFATWAIVLVLAVGGVRVLRVLAGKQAANSFASGAPHGGDRYWRLNRAQLNTAENLPIFAAIVMVGHVAGLRTGPFATAAIVVIAGRVVQSIVHVSSNANMIVNVRFTAFLAQLGAFLFMIGDIVATR
jgi:uncharacterized MAPEG superfamily protein